MKNPNIWYEKVDHAEWGDTCSVYIWLKSKDGKENRPIMEMTRCDATPWEFKNTVEHTIKALNAGLRG